MSLLLSHGTNSVHVHGDIVLTHAHTHTHSHTHSRLGTDRGIASSGSGLRPFWDISAEEGKKDEAAT